MRNLTSKKAITEHRKMWNWIADQIDLFESVMNITGLKEKYTKENGITLQNDCFLCEYAHNNKKPPFHCGSNCILKWKNRGCMRSEYFECCNAESQQEQHTLALKIANLEERKM